MLQVIDTHSHLYSNKFSRDQDAVIERAQEVLSAVFLPNIDLESVGPMHDLQAKAPNFFFPMMGLHPSHVKEDYKEVLEKIETLLKDPNRIYFGIGETGIDLYWDTSTFEIQQDSLRQHIAWAKERKLPIILHAREAINEVTDMLEEHHSPDLKGIVHCFDGNAEQAARIAALGTFKIGIGGIVTYRKDVQEMVRTTDLKHMVLETDSPYLPPEPHRKSKNRRNESSYTQYVAAKLAEIKGISYDEVGEITNANALALFDQAQINTSSPG